VSRSRNVGPRARKALGQHFLRDERVLARIVEALPAPDLPLVEIGPGTGALTRSLLQAGYRVIGLEIEPRMIRHLQANFGDNPAFEVHEGDARDVELAGLVGGEPYNVAGNLPYFAANPIIRSFLESERPPREAVVMVQKEVGKELAATPGHMSLLGISVAVYARAEYLFDVFPEAFEPPPSVMSGVVRLIPRTQPLVDQEELEPFFELVSRTFRNPRKQIHNSLSRGVWLPPGGADEALAEAGVEPARRPETLDVAEWLALLAATRRVLKDA
jgi:16S rRNA (adenine1518-N6/adenine1519-N6)-dimethyltransferase